VPNETGGVPIAQTASVADSPPRGHRDDAVGKSDPICVRWSQSRGGRDGRQGIWPEAAPAGLKLLHGTSEGRDSGGRRVKLPPKVTRAAPAAPDYLDEAALAERERVTPALEEQDLLSPTHQASLACYCQAVADHIAALAIIARGGRTITNPKTGHQHPHPAVNDARQSREQILWWARDFGLTPSDEQRFGTVAEMGVTVDVRNRQSRLPQRVR
jgi:P27 family predicted phage terminase small subunit